MSGEVPLPLFRLRPDDEDSLHCATFINSDILTAGSGTGKVLFWNLKSNRLCSKLFAGNTSILNLCAHDETLFIQEKEGILKKWSNKNGNYAQDFEIPLDYTGFCRFALSPDEQLLYAPKSNSSISVIDFSGNITTTLKPDTEENLGEVMSVKNISLNNVPYLLSSYESGHIKLWDLKMNKVISSLQLHEFILTLDFDECSERGVCGSSSENIQVFNITNQSLSHNSDIKMTNQGCNMLRIRKDKKILTSGGWDGQIRVYSWKSLKPLAVLSEHKYTLLDIVYSDYVIPLWNAKIMAAVSLDSSITLWNIYPT